MMGLGCDPSGRGGRAGRVAGEDRCDAGTSRWRPSRASRCCGRRPPALGRSRRTRPWRRRRPRRPSRRAATTTSSPAPPATATGPRRSWTPRTGCRAGTPRATWSPCHAPASPGAGSCAASSSRTSRPSSARRGPPGSHWSRSPATGATTARHGRSRTGSGRRGTRRRSAARRAPATRSTSSGRRSTSRAGPAWNRGTSSGSTSPTARWLAANAWRYGFVMSYPEGEDARSCYHHEPWHYRYVGRDVAAAVHAAGVPLRAYLWTARATAPPPRRPPAGRRGRPGGHGCLGRHHPDGIALVGASPSPTPTPPADPERRAPAQRPRDPRVRCPSMGSAGSAGRVPGAADVQVGRQVPATGVRHPEGPGPESARRVPPHDEVALGGRGRHAHDPPLAADRRVARVARHRHRHALAGAEVDGCAPREDGVEGRGSRRSGRSGSRSAPAPGRALPPVCPAGPVCTRAARSGPARRSARPAPAGRGLRRR